MTSMSLFMQKRVVGFLPLKRLLLMALFAVTSSTAVAIDCPSSHPFASSACGQCFASEAQASSVGCSIDDSTGGDEPISDNCPVSHPVYSAQCDQCFASEAQAESTGCSTDGGGTPTPPPPTTLPPTPPPPTVLPPTPTPSTPPTTVSGIFTPPAGQGLMIIGQDLASVSGYVDSGLFPTPGGVTAYVAFYDILNDAGNNGALGLSSNGSVNTADTNWGAGPLHAYNAAVGFPNSTLQIGLNIAEGSNASGQVWCGGCLSQLANGGFGDHIRQLANFFKRIGNTPVYLRVGYEFDGQWNMGYDNTSNYIAAYRRIVDGLRAEGVTNVAYVWQSSSSPIDDILEGQRESISDWYPGNNYVDWLGLSWFLLPQERAPVGGTVSTQLELASEVVDLARSLGKPVMIAESTPQGYDVSAATNSNISSIWDGAAGQNTRSLSAQGVWDEWFAAYFGFIRDNADVIQATSYINANWDTQGLWGPPYTEGYWGDGRVESNSVISNNWNAELNRSYWLHGGSSLFDTLSE